VYCWWHDPALAEQRKSYASKAAKSKANVEISTVKNRLKEIAEAVASGRMQTARGSVSGQVYGLVLKAIEQERRQHEVEDLKRQLEEVRDLYEQQKSQARGIGGSWWTS
jgi:division protein CdvB (Snf7/Vps24/ESCRT-III family)